AAARAPRRGRPASPHRGARRVARRRPRRRVPGGHARQRGRRRGPARRGVAGPHQRGGGPPGRLARHAAPRRGAQALAAPGRRGGGGAADRPLRWRAQRPRRRHRDPAGGAGRHGPRTGRNTEQGVNATDDRAAMAALGLDPDDFGAPDGPGSPDAEDGAAAPPTPVLAVVGRPNVGKSTLVNRLLGRREAVVQDVPGVTRDRVAYDALWNGRRFTIVDTGGWEPDATGLQAAVAAQADLAMRTADAVLLVVDASVGATATDEAVARVLRRSDRPVVLAATKVDDERLLADTAALWRLGLGEPHPVSGLHGRGSGDLLDAILAALPETPRDDAIAAGGGPRRVALVGKPNVGKSSLLNRLSGEQRAVVHEVAG